MQLRIVYRNKSVRVVNLSKEFFQTDKIWNHRLGREEPFTPQQKALSLAQYLDRDPYSVILTRGNKVLLNHVFRYNVPQKKQYA